MFWLKKMNLVIYMNDSKLTQKILNELPYEIIYKIYLFCPHKQKFQYDLFISNYIKLIILISLLISSSYFLGLLTTGNTSYYFVLFNIFIGYIILSAFASLLIMTLNIYFNIQII